MVTMDGPANKTRNPNTLKDLTTYLGMRSLEIGGFVPPMATIAIDATTAGTLFTGLVVQVVLRTVRMDGR